MLLYFLKSWGEEKDYSSHFFRKTGWLLTRKHPAITDRVFFSPWGSRRGNKHLPLIPDESTSQEEALWWSMCGGFAQSTGFWFLPAWVVILALSLQTVRLSKLSNYFGAQESHVKNGNNLELLSAKTKWENMCQYATILPGTQEVFDKQVSAGTHHWKYRCSVAIKEMSAEVSTAQLLLQGSLFLMAENVTFINSVCFVVQ